MNEVWKPVPDWPGYTVSNLGRVQGPRCLLSPAKDKDGYLKVALFCGGKQANKRVNRLVCAAFQGDPLSPDSQALHRDGNKQNNVYSNLYWGTHTDNMQDQIRLNEIAFGERNGNSKLTWAIVREIRRRASEGIVPFRLAKEFGISHRHCTLIVRNQMWAKEKDPEYA